MIKKKEQIELDCVSAPECVEIEICVEKIDKEVEYYGEKEVHKGSVKSQLVRLFRRAKRNAKYIEEVVPIQRLEQQRVYRDYGLR